MRIKREVEKKIRRLGGLNFRKAPCCSCLHAPPEHLRGRVARHASEESRAVLISLMCLGLLVMNFMNSPDLIDIPGSMNPIR